MWYKNKRTGKIWDITDKDILKRISRDSDYEPVEEEEEELPFVPDESDFEEEMEEETPEDKPVKKAGGRNGRTTAKTKK